MKLAALHEETLEGVGLKTALNRRVLPDKREEDEKTKEEIAPSKLAKNIAQVTQNARLQTKRNCRPKQAASGDAGKDVGVSLSDKSRLGTASAVPKNPRHRKFLGIDKPQTPY